jgi:NADH oxidase (H2O2-forming)
MERDAAGAIDPEEWSPRVIIIGGGVAGYAVARRIRNEIPRARVHLYDRNDWHHYSACGMTFAVEGMYDLDQVVLHTPEEYDDLGIEVHEGVEVVGLDLDGRTLRTSDGDQARFDVLVLATGRRAFKPPVPGMDLPGVHTLSNFGDAVSMMEALEAVSSTVVVGGGAIGLETAVSFRARDLEVTVVEMLPHLIPQMLDADTGATVREHVEGLGIRVLTGVPVGRIEAGDDGRVMGVDVLGETIPADLVVVSTGIRPETGLAEAAGLDLGETGGYATDEHMRVLRRGEPVDRVYAVGDCAEVLHAVLGRKTLSPLASAALYQARSVARHLVHPEHEHRSVVSPAVVVIGGLHVGNVGLTQHGGEYLGLGTWGLSAKGLDRSRYYPGAEDIHLRLVGDQAGNIVGAQAVGRRDVKERMNLMALVISEGIPAERLVEVERAYSPPVQLLADPLLGLLDEFVEAKKGMSD